MREKDFYRERRETKKANFACPFCRERADFDVRWLVREKKDRMKRTGNSLAGSLLTRMKRTGNSLAGSAHTWYARTNI